MLSDAAPGGGKQFEMTSVQVGVGRNSSADDAPNDSAKMVDVDTVGKSWFLISVVLILSTLFQSIKPSESYIPKYMKDIRQLSSSVINSDIYPFRTYAMVLGLLPVSYLSERVCGYVPLIIFGLFCRWFTQFGLYYGPGLISMQISYAVFGLSHATKIIYSAFMYLMVPIHVFGRITGYIRGANLLAHVVGGFTGQMILNGVTSFASGDESRSKPDSYFWMFFLSQTCVGLGVFLFLAALVMRRNAAAVVTVAAVQSASDPSEDEASKPEESQGPLANIVGIANSIYTLPDVLAWSVCWWICFGIVDQCWDYQSVLFLAMNPAGFECTGVITSCTRLGCAVAAMGSGRNIFHRRSTRFFAMAVCCAMVAIGLFISALTTNLLVSYVLFFVVMAACEFVQCSATAQIAIRTPPSLRGIALLANTTIAMAIQAISQFLTGPQMAYLDIRGKYLSWSIVVAGLSIFCFITSIQRKTTKIVPTDDLSDTPSLPSYTATDGGKIV